MMHRRSYTKDQGLGKEKKQINEKKRGKILQPRPRQDVLLVLTPQNKSVRLIAAHVSMWLHPSFLSRQTWPMWAKVSFFSLFIMTPLSFLVGCLVGYLIEF